MTDHDRSSAVPGSAVTGQASDTPSQIGMASGTTEYDEWGVLIPGAIRYGPYDEPESAETTRAALTVPSRLIRRRVVVTRTEWEEVD